LPQPRQLGKVGFDVHTLLYASLAVVAGFQSMMFWAFAKSTVCGNGSCRPTCGSARWCRSSRWKQPGWS